MSKKEGLLKERLKYELGTVNLGKIAEILDEAKKEYNTIANEDIELLAFSVKIHVWFKKWFGSEDPSEEGGAEK